MLINMGPATCSPSLMRNGAVHITPLPCEDLPAPTPTGASSSFVPKSNGLGTLHVPVSLFFFMGAKKTLQKPSKTQLSGRSAKGSPSLLHLICFPQPCQQMPSVLPWNSHGLTAIRERRVY